MFFDRVNRSLAPVAVAQVGTLFVVEAEPGVQIHLQGLHRLVELGAEGGAEELVQDGLVEALHEAVGAGSADLGLAMFDVVQGQEQFVGMALPAAELPAIVGEDGPDGQAPLLVLRQDVVVQDQGGLLGELAGVEVAEGVGAEGVHHGLQVDLAHALEHADVEGVLAQQFAGAGALDVPFLEAGVGLLDGGHLGRGELHLVVQGLGLEPEQTLVFGRQAVLDQDLLDRGAGDGHVAELELGTEPAAAPGGVLEGQRQDLRDHLRRGGGGVAVVDGRQVLESFQAVGLEAALVLVERGAVHPGAAAGLGGVAQGLGQLEHTEAVLGQFGGGIGHDLSSFRVGATGGSSVRYARSASPRLSKLDYTGEKLSSTGRILNLQRP